MNHPFYFLQPLHFKQLPLQQLPCFLSLYDFTIMIIDTSNIIPRTIILPKLFVMKLSMASHLIML